MLSRSMFLPGELPAMTHLGSTLFRHCLQAAVRYGRYHLGLPVATVPAVPVVHLRPYFEGDAEDPFDDLILDPGGEATTPLDRRAAAALRFHALRLRLFTRRQPTTPAPVGSSPWPILRHRVSRWVPALGDALLRDLDAVRRRRRARASGKLRPPCSSPQCATWLEATCLAGVDVGVAPVRHSFAGRTLADADPPRGALRDAWVAAAADFRPLLLDLGQAACHRGFLDEAEDARFLPFDLLEALERDAAPAWLAGGVDSNRAEWSALSESRAPAEALESVAVGVRLASSPAASELPPALAPLP